MKPGTEHELDAYTLHLCAKPSLRSLRYMKSFPIGVTSPLQDWEPNQYSYLRSLIGISRMVCPSRPAEMVGLVSRSSALGQGCAAHRRSAGFGNAWA